MDKNAIKKFAVWARTELIARVSLKGVEYGITEDNIEDANADSVGGKVLTAYEKKQRQALIAEINDKGYKQVIEEVAYTWFNRFSALRFMEVNSYLPSHVRVFTDEENNFKPQIITEAIHLDLDGLNMEKVYELKDAEKTEELYKYLLIVQCNALNKILPGMFQKISDYTELLLPDNLLRDGSVIQQMIELIPEDDWKDTIEIVGWLYQYYISERHDEVIKAVGKVTVNKEDIGAATQLFTPDWIVRYMVENSLGRLWLEGHPDVKEQLLPTEEEQSAYAAGKRDPEDTKWHYYLEEAEQEPEIQVQLAEICKEYAALTPDQLKVIDPCSGSGHILAYMFDVLMKIYESYGYTTREAVASIVENNLYGLDIDDRAAQLAYFAVMMKARQYDRRFFSRGIQPHVYAIAESNHVDKFAVDYFCNGDAKLTAAIDTIISELHDAKEYGSILTVTPQDWSALYERFAEITEDINMSRDTALRELLPLVQVAQILSTKFDAVITNPPYLNRMNPTLKNYVQKKYEDYAGDLFSIFMYRNLLMCKMNGYASFMTPNVWMFIKTYEKLRGYIISGKNISSLIQLAKGSFFKEAAVDIAAFTIRNTYLPTYKGAYLRLEEFKADMDVQKLKVLEAVLNSSCKYVYYPNQEDFKKIEATPIAYWCTEKLYHHFETAPKMLEVSPPRVGLQTGDNNSFLRLWFEIERNKMCVNAVSSEDAELRHNKWFPYNKGGEFRRWYGNRYYVVNWENGGLAIRNCRNEAGKVRSALRNSGFYFKSGITWSDITSGSFSGRFCENGFLFDVQGSSSFPKEDILLYVLGFLNSSVSQELLQMLNPTLHTQVGDLSRLPLVVNYDLKKQIEKVVQQCIDRAKEDWNRSEISWSFKKNALCTEKGLISQRYEELAKRKNILLEEQQSDEETINTLFIDVYDLQEEMSPNVDISNITLSRTDITGEIKAFISYAVGCMFGRYSLDMDGLVYAGGEWDASKYVSFAADKDNIIPICDDQYFEDDIVGLFVEFVKTVYGVDTLDENLKFIADALGSKGQPKDVIRNYFLSDFYSDHCKIYQKRPIYWLFDSGKKNGFKALIYMHRYQPDTIARIRTDYVHEQQARYRTAIADLEQRIANASTGERVKLNKKLTTLQAQDTEIRAYEEKIHHLADQMISIDLDDGVKKNYAIFQDVLAKIK